ncbi:WXG100 family type VII secretion target [Kibdelosporangium philippinense]|uniref:ESAT-6-like protein n=1 Tax=Kibdelosporangium philippinense TaxID=211113 RepID=A0ABS8ZD57_9PSEU|nr:WXG100 family type VII secretion target [Kibdelosporangium philippinense]MCE7005781.1 WXG100 family type VII secretion target [Kibdelosporangium philippinense]
MPDGMNIKVDFAAVENAGNQIKATAGKMDGELDTLRSQLAPLGAAYEGDAKQEWERVQTTWNQAQNDLNQVLAQIGAATMQAATEYQSTEHGVKRLWG